jgi:hypothetical protein
LRATVGAWTAVAWTTFSLIPVALGCSIAAVFPRGVCGRALRGRAVVGAGRAGRVGARAAACIAGFGDGAWRRGGGGAGLGEFFDGDRDVFVRAVGVAVVEADKDELGQDLRVDDGAVAFGGADAGLLAGEALGEFFVGLVFVAEAAHEPAAAAADLEGIERGLLHLGGLHGDGLQDLEEVLAAAVLAAAFVVGGEACFVAGADLAELDAGAELGREGADEVAEVDAVFGEVVEGEAFAAQEGLGVDDLHREGVGLGDLAGAHLELVPGLLDGGLLVEVFAGGDAEDAAFGGEGVVAPAGVLDVLEHLLAGDALGAGGVRAGAGEHLADLGPAVGADDELGAAAGLGLAVVGEFADELHCAEADDDGGGWAQVLVGAAVFGAQGGKVGLELWERVDGHGGMGRRKEKREKRTGEETKRRRDEETKRRRDEETMVEVTGCCGLSCVNGLL